MAELAARIIERKCSLPVVVLIHLDGERGGNGSLSVANSSITLERSVVHPFETEILLAWMFERR